MPKNIKRSNPKISLAPYRFQSCYQCNVQQSSSRTTWASQAQRRSSRYHASRYYGKISSMKRDHCFKYWILEFYCLIFFTTQGHWQNLNWLTLWTSRICGDTEINRIFMCLTLEKLAISKVHRILIGKCWIFAGGCFWSYVKRIPSWLAALVIKNIYII